MFYGRVIGNELRDVPPECLPIWGQRWSGYRAPYGPSPFSTRVFSADQMSEMGPVLTSPSQFETTLAEEDERENTSSESSQLHSSFPPSPLAIPPDAAGLIPLPEMPTPWSVHHSSGYPHSSLEILHRNTELLPPQKSTCSSAILPMWRFEQSGIHYHPSEPVSYPPTPCHGVSTEGGRRSFDNNHTPWDTDYTLTNFQLAAGFSHWNHVPSGQLQHTMASHRIPEWQLADAHSQPVAYPLHPNPPSHGGSDYLLQPLQADGRTQVIVVPPPPSHCFTLPLSQQNVGTHSSSSITMIPGITHPRNPMVSQWPSESLPLDSSFLEPIQSSRPSIGSGASHYLVFDCHRSSLHPEISLDISPHAEGCTLLSPDEPRGDQSIR